jgi:hypothetical protein
MTRRTSRTSPVMVIQLQDSDLPLVLDFKFKKYEESGHCRLPAGWKEHSLTQYRNLYLAGKCRHSGYRVENRIVALAGALLCDETPFLCTKPVRHGMFVDEYTLPGYRNPDIVAQLRANLQVWLDENGACLSATIPANSARLSCAAGNFRW